MDEQEVVAQIKKKKEIGTNNEQKALKKNQQSLSRRLTELESLTTKLYEEMVLGDIPRETVLQMIDKYKKDQTEKSALLSEITKKLSATKEMDNDIKEWIKLIKSCTNIDTIDRPLLIKLIDKIIVGQKTEVDGVVKQDITIIYNLLGEEASLSLCKD